MKDSFYFPHDFHARHDPKLERLRMTIGCEGVGIFWCLVEMLYEEGGSLPIQDIEIYSKALNCKLDTLLKTLREYNLFVENKTHFWSPTLIKRLKHITSKREKARASAKLSHSANAERTLSERSAIKESKVKESKVKKNSPPLSDEEFLKTLKENQAYKHINIDLELGKIDAHILVHKGKQKTRRFIVAWLNRIDKPLGVTTTPRRELKPKKDCQACKGSGRLIVEGKSAQCYCLS